MPFYGLQTDVVTLDFSKAFDTVPHNKLLHKFDDYHVRGSINRWLEMFLTQRKMKVVIDGDVSWSCCVLMFLWSRQSSAKSLTDDLTKSGKSLMWQRKRRGPSTVPCGTPESTVIYCILTKNKTLIYIVNKHDLKGDNHFHIFVGKGK
jgi:hypothetical protein